MKHCDRHWTMLREAITARGLDHLVAANGREAAARTADDLAGQSDDSTFDPLMTAYWMVTERAMSMGGLYLLTGDYCAVCEAIKGHAAHLTADETERHYTDGPADAVLARARELGLAVPLMASEAERADHRREDANG